MILCHKHRVSKEKVPHRITRKLDGTPIVNYSNSKYGWSKQELSDWVTYKLLDQNAHVTSRPVIRSNIKANAEPSRTHTRVRDNVFEE